MNFISLSFIILFIITVLFYNVVNKKHRYKVILIANIIFYLSSGFQNFFYLMSLCIFTYSIGLILSKVKGKRSKNIVLFFGFVTPIIVLFGLKYYCFGVSLVNRFFEQKEINLITPVNIMIPLGISFFTFQMCTYVADVYKKNIDAEINFLKYCTFATFFPTLLSGPIQKSRDLIPQIEESKKVDLDIVKSGLMLVIYGFIQKLIISNSLAVITDSIFDNAVYQQGNLLLFAAICYSFQIYVDFSSYSDIAIGLSRIIGIDAGINFKRPYLSKSISEFWGRWHMSLNRWLQEYIYIPLGGNRKGKLRKYLNTMLVFLFYTKNFDAS